MLALDLWLCRTPSYSQIARRLFRSPSATACQQSTRGRVSSQGGLISCGADPIETFTGAATYADRILKGAQPNELPVQLPTTFYLALNLTTAKTLGISFPQSLLPTADEVIE
jgi:ABC-type uncharacterized transport system substrate-binding protein